MSFDPTLPSSNKQPNNKFSFLCSLLSPSLSLSLSPPFDREGAVNAFLPVLPYFPVSADASDGYGSRDRKRHGHGHSYSSGYGGSSDLAAGDAYGSYGGSQPGGSRPYGAYGSCSLGQASTAGLSSQNNASRSKNMLTKLDGCLQLRSVKAAACLLPKPEDQMS